MIASPTKRPRPRTTLALARLMASSACLLGAGPAPPQDPPKANPPTLVQDLFRLPEFRTDDAELAGLPRGSRPEVVTARRAYALALIRARSGPKEPGAALAGSLDPGTLEADSARLGVGDFARFRGDFLGRGQAPAFRDPSAALFDVLHRLQAVEDSVRNLAAAENLGRLVRELVQGEAAGLSQLDVDRVSVSIQEARIRTIDRGMRYRDALDAWRVGLGLSPHAPVVPDREALAGFRDAFEAAERWSVDASRSPEQLDELAQRLPTPDDLAIGDRSLSSVFSGIQALADLELEGARIALEDRGRGEPDVDRELRVRRRIRGLAQGLMEYQIEKRRFVLNLRRRSDAREQLIAPPQPAGAQNAMASMAELAAIQGQILENRDRLVGLWATHQAERLALLRDLGTLPEGDWKSFLERFATGPGGPRQPEPAQEAPKPR